MGIVPADGDGNGNKLKNELAEYSKKDLLNIVLKSTLGALPVVGAAFAELVEVVIPKSSFDRLVDFTAKLSQDLRRLEGRLDAEFVKKEETAFMFREVLSAVVNNYQ